MLRRLLHALVNCPTVYGWCQHTIGAGHITERIAAYVPLGYSRVLDVGAGKGYTRRMWPPEAHYFVIDNDWAMLAACNQPLSIMADASDLPVRTDSMDMVLLKQVSHHIPDHRLDDLFGEIRRILRPDGRLLFMDAVENGELVSSLLWRYDRGSHPRTKSDLLQHMERHFEIRHRETHRHLHEYLLMILTPLPSSQPSTGASGEVVGEARKVHWPDDLHRTG